ncbi:hypothetical protein ACU8KH_05446 [Lachancea thermotolerans]
MGDSALKYRKVEERTLPSRTTIYARSYEGQRLLRNMGFANGVIDSAVNALRVDSRLRVMEIRLITNYGISSHFKPSTKAKQPLGYIFLLVTTSKASTARLILAILFLRVIEFGLQATELTNQ